MKKVFIILAMLCIVREDSASRIQRNQKGKSLHGGRKCTSRNGKMDKRTAVNELKNTALACHLHHWGNNHVKPANLSTNWLIVDLGFTNYNDKTNYRALPLRHLLREVIKLVQSEKQ